MSIFNFPKPPGSMLTKADVLQFLREQAQECDEQNAFHIAERFERAIAIIEKLQEAE